MFHDGDLQSGISLAISQQRTVACFIRDDGPDSSAWEEEWLIDPSLAGSLASKAVVLRIQAGSQEAGFLSAFCKVDKAPSLVLIRNGQLMDNIVIGVEKDDFIRRVLAALGEDDGSTSIPAESSTVTEAAAAAPVETTPQSSNQEAATSKPTEQQSPPPTDSSHPPSYSTANLQSLFPDRPSQLDTTHQQQQEAERAKAAAAKARREAEQDTGKPKTARNDYAAQQKQRLAEAKKERERIMAQIEADKVARKQREKERKEAEQATMSSLAKEEAIPADTRRPSRKAGAAASANIQVRLFSGKTLRGSFPATATLDRDIRAWVDEAAAEDAQLARPPPYVFRHILNPLPSKTIEVGEESQSLVDLDMLPSATLVLEPVHGAVVDAFGAGGASGLLGYAYQAASGVFGILGGALGWIAATLGSVVGFGGTRGNVEAAPAEEPRAQPTGTDGASDREDGKSKVRVRTLADGRAEDAKDKPETWYNGNQTSYQPKDDPGEGPS